MKKLTTLFMCIFVFANLSHAQTPAIDYTIVNVKGIVKKPDGKQLAKGQKVNVNDKIKFSKDAIMLITDATKKINIVVEPSNATATKIEMDYPLSTFLMVTKKAPAVKVNQPTIRTPEDFTQFFKDKLFILGTEAHFIVGDAFEMDENHFFYVNGKFGAEALNKQLDYKDSLLIITKSVLSDAVAKPISTEVEMLYIDVKVGDSVPICKINLSFIDEPALKPKLQTIVDLYLGTGIVKNDMPKEIAAYISQYYGKTNLENITTWMNKNLKVL